jgi:endonuclease G
MPHRCSWAAVILLVGSWPVAADPGDDNIALGNPSGAKADRKKIDYTNFLIVKEQYALSYNDKKGTPNWVSYRLVKEDMGRAPRPKDFLPDKDDLPRGFHLVSPFDYHFARTGMSRGHMCPNAHRSDKIDNAEVTFYMTNMVPQTEELNDGAWKFLEIECAELCRRRNKELFIVCGPHGVGGTSVKGTFKTIDDGRITVPKHCWKVVLVLDRGTTAPEKRVNKNTPVIAVLMPNDRSPKDEPWEKYATTLENIESLTGYRFFDKVPADILNELRKKEPKHEKKKSGLELPGREFASLCWLSEWRGEPFTVRPVECSPDPIIWNTRP